MGIAIDRTEFEDEEYLVAAARLHENLRALQQLLMRDDFGVGPPSLGAELEMSIVDARSQAMPLNRKVLAEALNPNLQLEIDSFNLEYNLSPVAAAGEPFGTMQAELESALDALRGIAAQHGGRIVPIGILPTLRLEHLQSDAMTDLPRYKALSAGINRIRQEDFHIRIDGEEPLEADCNSVAIEGANTSFQLHLRVDPRDFARCYNAAQLMTPLALAVAANSPFLMGHSLWDETRIALFKQSVDTRGSSSHAWRRAARVPFGHGWIRSGAYELFAESCYLYPIIIPLVSDERPLSVVADSRIPELSELRLHQGTIWNWNRPVYDSAGGGHLRIELRSLPAGPTPLDMMANAAYLIGMTIAMSHRINELLPAFPFRYAEYNFYRAAQHGLGAKLLWPSQTEPSPVERSVAELCRTFLPVADEGLAEIGVADTERRALLGIISDRLDGGMTAADWQRRTLARLGEKPRWEALAALVEEYISQSASGRPVSEWH